PVDCSLDQSVVDLWSDPSWLRFFLAADAQEGAADGLFVRAVQQAAGILERGLPAVTRRNVWPRVPQWRCLTFMLWQEDIRDAYLVVEHESGDSAVADEARLAPLTEVLEAIWWNYCINQETEDAAIYRIDLTSLPR